VSLTRVECRADQDQEEVEIFGCPFPISSTHPKIFAQRIHFEILLSFALSILPRHSPLSTSISSEKSTAIRRVFCNNKLIEKHKMKKKLSLLPLPPSSQAPLPSLLSLFLILFVLLLSTPPQSLPVNPSNPLTLGRKEFLIIFQN